MNKSILDWLNRTWGKFWAIIASGMALSGLLVQVLGWEPRHTIATISGGCIILIVAGIMLDHQYEELTHKSDMRNDEIHEKLNETLNSMEKLSCVIDEVRKDTVRMQLLSIMRNSPEDEKSILDLAELYFVKLKGDFYVTRIFADWAKNHDVEVDDLLTIAKLNHDKDLEV